jgi:hypothetical protein
MYLKALTQCDEWAIWQVNGDNLELMSSYTYDDHSSWATEIPMDELCLWSYGNEDKYTILTEGEYFLEMI